MRGMKAVEDGWFFVRVEDVDGNIEGAGIGLVGVFVGLVDDCDFGIVGSTVFFTFFFSWLGLVVLLFIVFIIRVVGFVFL